MSDKPCMGIPASEMQPSLEDQVSELKQRIEKIENHLWEKFGELP